MHSEEMIEKVRKLYKKHKSYREVARKLEIDHSSVRYMINNDYTRTKKKCGPRKKISNRELTKIKKEVRRLKSENQRVFASKIKSNCSIDANIRTIQRELAYLGFGYKNVSKKLPLTKTHKQKRVELSRLWIEQNLIGKNIVFTDEKRFSLDGPDNWCSWYDPFDPPQRIKRQMNGGGIMVWGMTLSTGEIHVELLEGRVNSSVYTSLLNDKIIPILDEKFGAQMFRFQQDNCKVHVSKETKSFFESKKIQTFEWPSMSPDMNIQENVWKMISDIVYDQKQYDSTDNLWKSVVKSVKHINAKKKEVIKSLYDNYNRRLLKVIDNNGNDIPY